MTPEGSMSIDAQASFPPHLSEWVDLYISNIQALEQGGQTELTLPPAIDHHFFISRIGMIPATFEYSGLYDPKTRSLLVMRSSLEEPFGGFRSNFLPPRRNAEGDISDIFFHTHPLVKKDRPGHACLPSNRDINNTLAVRMVEEDEGLRRPIETIIAAAGFICKITSNGISIDREKLKSANLSNEKIRTLEEMLALSPPSFLKHCAKDEEAGRQLSLIVKQFYQSKRDGESFSKKANALRIAIEPLLADRHGRRETKKQVADYVMANIVGHFPELPTYTFLENTGYSSEQIRLIRSMIDVTIARYSVPSNGTLESVPITHAEFFWF